MDPKKKPSLALAFGPKPAMGDGDDGEDYGDDAPDEGLQTACDEFLAAAGLDVPDDARAKVCDALRAFVKLASAPPAPDDGEG